MLISINISICFLIFILSLLISSFHFGFKLYLSFSSSVIFQFHIFIATYIKHPKKIQVIFCTPTKQSIDLSHPLTMLTCHHILCIEHKSPRKIGALFSYPQQSIKLLLSPPPPTCRWQLQFRPPHLPYTTVFYNASPQKSGPFFCTSNTQSAVILDPSFFSTPTLYTTVYLLNTWPLFALW